MSKIMGTGVLALWLDVAPALDRETDAWYIDEHMPERIDIGGYLRARRYQALQGSPAYLTMFEARTPADLASEGYLSLVQRISEQSKRIRAGFSNVARGTFQVGASAGRGLGAVIATLRLAPRSERPSQAQMAAVVQDLLRKPGIVGVHWLQPAPEIRARMDAVRATGTGDATVHDVLMVEAARAVDLDALRAEGPLSAAALPGPAWQEADYGVYGLLYEVSATPAGAETMLGDRQ
jgi:hypothetical protein